MLPHDRAFAPDRDEAVIWSPYLPLADHWIDVLKLYEICSALMRQCGPIPRCATRGRESGRPMASWEKLSTDAVRKYRPRRQCRLLDTRLGIRARRLRQCNRRRSTVPSTRA